jgi:hypothetical protein
MAHEDRKGERIVGLFTQSLALFFGCVVGGAAFATKFASRLTTFRNLKSFARNSPEAKSAAYAVTGYAFLFGSGICAGSAYVSGKLFVYRLGVSSIEEAMQEFKIASGYLNSSMDKNIGPYARKLGSAIKENFPQLTIAMEEIADDVKSQEDENIENEIRQVARIFGINVDEIAKETSSSRPSSQVLDRVRQISSTVKKQANIPESENLDPEIQKRVEKISSLLNLKKP